MIRIDTDRLVLRNFIENDLNDLINLISDYSSSKYSRYDQKWPIAEDELLKVLQWFSSNDIYLAVHLKENDSFIGFVNLTKEDSVNPITYNIGYIFNSKYHNNGYAYEACRAYIEYAKREYGAQEIITGTAKENERSCKLLEKMGFKKVKEEKVHLQTDENGNPIDFIGCMYKLIV